MTSQLAAPAEGTRRSSSLANGPTPEPSRHPRRTSSGLLGRRRECAVLDDVLAEARSRRSAAVVVTGEPGSGKSALLGHVRASAVDFQVLRCCGVESEMELPYAGLHQMCSALLGRLDQLPGPQRHALRAALGLAAPTAAQDRFLVGLAVLSLVAMKSDEQPLLCVVDDAQWLDHASLQTLAFTARRLRAEPIAVVFALREGTRVVELAGLPTLMLRGLENADAYRLLASAVHAPLDEHVRDRIVAEANGNPLALQELPRGLSPEQLAGGFAIPDAGSLTTRIEDNFLRRVESLPGDTQLLLLTAAAEPVGEMSLLWRAARQLGVGPWLQRRQRHHDARAHLRIAHDMFTDMGAEVWACRAARELRSAGESVRRRITDAGADLTAHEAQIARLACDGLSNIEIGARLFLSPRTVEWHLGNVFAKLGITSRRELSRALARPRRLSA